MKIRLSVLMRMVALIALLGLALLAACDGQIAKLGALNSKQKATLTIACGSVGQDLDFCTKATQEWSEKTGHTVNVFTTPQSTTDILGLFTLMFTSKSSDLDIINIDMVWTGLLSKHLLDLKPYSKKVEQKFFPVLIANNTVDGKLLAMPWFIDLGLLFYRQDLLEQYNQNVPTTWEQLTNTAMKIQSSERSAGRKDMQGYVFQGKTYEGLTCNALEWIYSHNGGRIVEANGLVSVNNPQAAKALNTAASWVGTIAPKNVLNYSEEDARGVFQNGNSVFMRNWAYAWSMANANGSVVKGKVGVASLPKGGEQGKSASTLGGWQLAVSKYSKNPEIAADLVMYLTSTAVQKDRAIRGSYNPAITSLYSDTEVLAANPFMGSLLAIVTNAIARPSSVTKLQYKEVSNVFWTASHDVLSGKQTAEKALIQLDEEIRKILQ